MAKHNIDPVLAQLIHSVNESGRVAVPGSRTTGARSLVSSAPPDG
jgi:hypothetical protein